MPDLEGVPNRRERGRFEGAPPRHDAAATTACQGRRRRGIARELREKIGDLRLVEALALGKLPEDGTELLAQRQEALGKEGGERLLNADELLHMGDEAAPLEREDEIVRRLLVPATEAVRSLQRIEGAIDLNRVEGTTGKFELATVRQAFGIEIASPGGVEPAGDADADHYLGKNGRRFRAVPGAA